LHVLVRSCYWRMLNSTIHMTPSQPNYLHRTSKVPPAISKCLDVFYMALCTPIFPKLINNLDTLFEILWGPLVGGSPDVRPKIHRCPANRDELRCNIQWEMSQVYLLLCAFFHFHVIMVMRFPLSRLCFYNEIWNRVHEVVLTKQIN